MKKFSVILFLLSSLVASAQDRLTLSSGETLEGRIEVLLPAVKYEEVLFEKDEKKTRYKAHEIVNFTQDDKEFRTVKFGDKYRIMEVEVDGYLSLLKFRSASTYAFNAQLFKKLGGEGIEIPNFMFKKSMASFLEDCPSVKEAIEAGVYRKSDLELLAKDYNTCIQQKTDDKYVLRNTQESPKNEKLSTPLIDEIQNLSRQAEQQNDIELANMLKDVISKMENGATIPSYLKNALSNHVKGNHELKDAVQTIVKQL